MNYTREEIKLLREGYIAGRTVGRSYTPADAELYAAHRYPMPKKTVPNVLKDDLGNSFRLAGDGIEIATPGYPLWNFYCPASAAKIIAELVAHPTIEVDDNTSDARD